jgi:hypothetical protein
MPASKGYGKGRKFMAMMKDTGKTSASPPVKKK